MPVVVPSNVKTIDQITIQEVCDFSQGHCYGSDGGSGVPYDIKVATGRGGDQEVWTVSLDGKQIEKMELYLRCQFCQKYVYSETIS